MFTVSDHPRVCGDDQSVLGALHRPVGSPPHVRGLHLTGNAIAGPLRITPACAGTTIEYLLDGAAI